MFRFHGGQTVQKGTYWNLRSGESIEAAHGSVLPGDGRARYIRFPASGIFVLGPVFGLLFMLLIPLVSLVVALTLLTRVASASDALKSEEAGMCLGCHSSQGMVKTFPNGEKLSITLGDKHFKGTVHGFLTCTGCHMNVSMDTHPSSSYGSKRDFAVDVSSACRNCHPDEQIMAKPLHKQAITKAHAPPCSDCHGSHSITKVGGAKDAADSQYCLTCHKKDLKISISGETLSLTVDEKTIKKSVHSNHMCSDCHTGFSRKAHPITSFGSKRLLSIAVADACRRCHMGKYTQFEGSVHFRMLKEGNLNAPVCTDCHGSHSVGKKALMETVSGVPCRKCHENIFEAYSGSVHGMARASGKGSAPLCASCHFAHEVKPAVISRSPKVRCLGCHETVLEAHTKWLPNAGLHFDAVACTACHVPGVDRNVYLHITDNSSGAVVSEPEIKAALGLSLESGGQETLGIGSRQLWDIYQKLNNKATRASLRGTMGIEDCVKSHSIAPKAKAIKQCDNCHSAGAQFFKKVTIAVIKPDGSEDFYKVNPAVLSSIMSILPLNHFYALGSTRLKVLDFLGVFMVIAGASVPVAHLTLRMLTRKLRASKKHGGRH